MKPTFHLFRDSITSWKENDAISHSSTVAYFTMFSIAPLLIIVSAVVGLVFSKSAAEGLIVNQIEHLVGTEIAAFIENIIENSHSATSHSVVAIIGALVMLYGASLLFYRLEIALNAMWSLVPIEVDVQKSVIAIARSRMLSAVAALGLGLYVLIALIAGTLWALIPQQILQYFFADFNHNITALIGLVASPVMYMIPFAVIYKMLPRAKVRWRDVWLGAAIAALLFWIGGHFIGFYIGHSSFGSLYGAAGSLVAFLLWVFYSAAVFLFGATFIKTYAAMYGKPIEPYQGMIFKPTYLEMLKLLEAETNEAPAQNEKSGSE